MKYYKVIMFIIMLTVTCITVLSACGSDNNVQTQTGDLTETEETTEEVTEEPRIRTHSIVDFEGWWEDAEYKFYKYYIDIENEKYYTYDRYGNLEFTHSNILGYNGIYYNESEDELGWEGLTMDIYLYFKGDDMNSLYYEDYAYSGDEKSAFVRTTPPVAPDVSIDGYTGKWYRRGITDTEEVYIMEITDDGVYKFIDSNGNVEYENNYVITKRIEKINRDTEYEFTALNLENEYEYAYLSNDKNLMVVYDLVPSTYSSMQNELVGEYYIHESVLGTSEEDAAALRYLLYDLEINNTDGNGRLEFSLNDHVIFYNYSEDKDAPDLLGSWEYKDETLTIVFYKTYAYMDAVDLDEPITESCHIVDIYDGFTLQSFGDFVATEPEY